MTKDIKKIASKLFGDFLYSTNFFHNIEIKGRASEYKYSLVTRLFLGSIFFLFFIIWFIKSPTTHVIYSTYFGHIDNWIQDFVVLAMALSFMLFSSFGLKDMFNNNRGPKNSVIFWISLLFELAFFGFVFWIQISGYIKTEGQALFSKIGVYLLFIFAAIPTIIWIYRKVNLNDYWMFLKFLFQSIIIGFNWSYNSHYFRYNKKYSLLINDVLKNKTLSDIDKIKENIQDRIDQDKVIINFGMIGVACIVIGSLFTGFSIWKILSIGYIFISSISGYIGLSSPVGIAILVSALIILGFLIFSICLLIRKVNITILEQIEIYEQRNISIK